MLWFLMWQSIMDCDNTHVMDKEQATCFSWSFIFCHGVHVIASPYSTFTSEFVQLQPLLLYFPFYSATNNQTSTTIHYWNWIRVSWFTRVCWIWSLCWCLEMLHILPTDIPWYLPLVYSSWQYIFGFIFNIF